MKPAKITNLSITPSQFGGELLLEWRLPSPLPTKPKIFVFRRVGSDVTELEIGAYFTAYGLNQPFSSSGLYIKSDFDKLYTFLSDVTVENGLVYYYKIVIRDEDSGELSDSVGTSGTPLSLLKINVVDGKDVVVKALGKVLDNIYVTPDRKVSLNKEIVISKQFNIDPIAPNSIMVERVNGSTYYQFWGNEYAKLSTGTVQADIDTDVMRVTFLTTDTPERRDLLANIFRANKILIQRACKKLGAIQCLINMEGDYYNPSVHGVNAVGFTMIITLFIINKVLIPQENLTYILGELIVDGN